jgi:hypothetical protein
VRKDEEALMKDSAPLHGIELIDCAKANRKEGIAIAAQRSGYGDDLVAFEQELRKACEAIGVEISFHDLDDTPSAMVKEPGLEIAPETPNQL